MALFGSKARATGKPRKAIPSHNPALKLDLVGPTVDDDISLAIRRHGKEAVAEAVKRLTKPKLGRRRVNDIPELREVFEADALDWLSGGDPIAARTNHAIAQAIAENNRGRDQSHDATVRRIMRRLKTRKSIMLSLAREKSRDGYPFAIHIKALEALAALDAALDREPIWEIFLNRAKTMILEHEQRTGKPPRAELSIKEVEEELRRHKDVDTAMQEINRNFEVLGRFIGPLVSEPLDKMQG